MKLSTNLRIAKDYTLSRNVRSALGLKLTRLMPIVSPARPKMLVVG